MIRDAFRRWVPFVGSGGLYSPGPATFSPLLAMRRPLDDNLSSPWVLGRSSPVLAVRPTLDARFARSDRRRFHPPTLAPT